MRISDWSADVCSSDLVDVGDRVDRRERHDRPQREVKGSRGSGRPAHDGQGLGEVALGDVDRGHERDVRSDSGQGAITKGPADAVDLSGQRLRYEQHDAEALTRSEEHTSELQSLMRISY